MNFNPEWKRNPLTTCAIIVTRLLDSLFRWLGARIDASKCRHDVIAIRESTGVALRELAAKGDDIVVRSAPQAQQEYSGTIRSLNLTRRARAMHMRRRGEEPHTIAAALGIPRGEVELLFKLDQIFQQTPQN
jgi:hypothetical protein